MMAKNRHRILKALSVVLLLIGTVCLVTASSSTSEVALGRTAARSTKSNNL